MASWTLDDLPWHDFDAARVEPQILRVVKAASLVERNAADYTTYLNRVFADDPAFRVAIDHWGTEEERHGDALGRWAELADPAFRFATALERFRAGYSIDTGAEASIRGSCTGELIARCIVETGTSSFYSALRDATTEPLLKAICHRIAGDEFRHYKLFYDTMRRYQARERIGSLARLGIAVGRIRESEDDELSYAYHAANSPADAPYDRAASALAYAASAFSCYRAPHVARASNMVFKAAGLNPQGGIGRLFGKAMWIYVARRARRLESLSSPGGR